jgi:hypothetical protein
MLSGSVIEVIKVAERSGKRKRVAELGGYISAWAPFLPARVLW